MCCSSGLSGPRRLLDQIDSAKHDEAARVAVLQGDETVGWTFFWVLSKQEEEGHSLLASHVAMPALAHSSGNNGSGSSISSAGSSLAASHLEEMRAKMKSKPAPSLSIHSNAQSTSHAAPPLSPNSRVANAQQQPHGATQARSQHHRQSSYH